MCVCQVKQKNNRFDKWSRGKQMPWRDQPIPISLHKRAAYSKNPSYKKTMIILPLIILIILGFKYAAKYPLSQGSMWLCLWAVPFSKSVFFVVLPQTVDILAVLPSRRYQFRLRLPAFLENRYFEQFCPSKCWYFGSVAEPEMTFPAQAPAIKKTH